jgi:esterase/lipase superfamily enzyme
MALTKQAARDLVVSFVADLAGLPRDQIHDNLTLEAAGLAVNRRKRLRRELVLAVAYELGYEIQRSDVPDAPETTIGEIVDAILAKAIRLPPAVQQLQQDRGQGQQPQQQPSESRQTEQDQQGSSSPSQPDVYEDIVSPSAAPQSSMAAPAASAPPRTPSSRVRVYFGTDRFPEPAIVGAFTAHRGERLSIGWCDVAIPKDHRLAMVERPSLWRLEFAEDPDKHFVILERHVATDAAAFWQSLRESPSDSALLFIHGYNVGFDDAVYRTAQIAYDLEFQGRAFLYSWTSNGELLRYASDIENNDFTVPSLKEFITCVANESGADVVHIIAHSMGNRALTNALYQLALERRPLKAKLHNIILAAPDIDAGVFGQLASTMAALAQRTTLYASNNDRALNAAMKLAGYPRAGDAKRIVVVKGVDSVDTSSVETDFLGHSYYGDTTTILSDIFHVVKNGLPPAQRFGMRAVPVASPTYWEFRPAR